MVRSMTAFARQETETGTGTLSWEVRSLNHRYLEVGLRLPEELRAIETVVRERIGARLGRGKVDCTCRLQIAGGASQPVEIDENNLARLIEVCDMINRRLDTPAAISAIDLLRWPGVVQEQAADTGPLVDAALALLDRVLDELVAGREREGEQIRTVMLARCAAMQEQVAHVRTLLPAIRTALRDRLQARLAEVSVEADPGRLEQELALQLGKIDVDEELDRLGGHVEEVRRVLDQDRPVGRRLDFLMQELNREANTLGSKSVAAATTAASVELKVLIEQLREQVQNME